jgi:uncharacterized protein (TIGR02300 family)
LASPELGAKQICPTCQAKFYDLGRRPAVFPKCHNAFDPEEAIRSRRVRARATPVDYETEEDTEDKARKKPAEGEDGFEDEVEDTPEIDEVAEAPPIEDDDDAEAVPGEPAPADPSLGVDFEEDAPLEDDDTEDVPFLEEEEDDFPDDEIEGLPEPDEER